MVDQKEFPSKEISINTWDEYAYSGRIEDLDEILVEKFGLILPEAFSSAISINEYPEAVRVFFVNQYRLGENKLRDRYVVRRCSLTLAKAFEDFKKGNSNQGEIEQIEGNISEVFHILSEKYGNCNNYFEDFNRPEIFLSIFGPVIGVLPKDSVEKVLNTIMNDKDKDAVMRKISEKK